MDPLLGFTDSDSDYTGTDVEVGDWCPEDDEDSDEGDEDYDPFEFDIDSDVGSDCVSFRSESSTPASYYVVDGFDWPTPYQGQIADGEGYQHASAFKLLEFPPQDSPSLPSSSSHVPPLDPFDLGTARTPGIIPWSAFTDPFTGAPITAPPYNPLSHWPPPIIPRMIVSPNPGQIGSSLRWRRGYGSLQDPLQIRLSIRLRKTWEGGMIGSISPITSFQLRHSSHRVFGWLLGLKLHLHTR
jgi:hypothetical protein